MHGSGMFSIIFDFFLLIGAIAMGYVTVALIVKYPVSGMIAMIPFILIGWRFVHHWRSM